MTFGDAVHTCLMRKYADFSGRARRSEYWYFALFGVIVSIVADIVDSLLNTDFGRTGLVAVLSGLALVIPSLAVSVRRLHDISRSGWWVLIALVPVVGWIVLLVFAVMDSHPDNQYGPSPEAGVASY